MMMMNGMGGGQGMNMGMGGMNQSMSMGMNGMNQGMGYMNGRDAYNQMGNMAMNNHGGMAKKNRRDSSFDSSKTTESSHRRNRPRESLLTHRILAQDGEIQLLKQAK